MLVAVLAITLSGCVGQTFEMGQERYAPTRAAQAQQRSAAQAANQADVPQTGGQMVMAPVSQTMAGGSAKTTAEQPTVSYTLVGGIGSDGRMVFTGRGGAIDGQVNPDLTAIPGDVVEIVVINGDPIQHNLALPDFGIQSEDVLQKDEQTRVVFKVDQDGEYAYYCAVPGHRQAGMEGRLIVGQPAVEDDSNLADIVRPPDELPEPIANRAPETVQVELVTTEVTARLADGVSYKYFTFNNKVPGPFIRVRVGDTLEVTLRNEASSMLMHSVDFHAATGPGGGAVGTQTNPGETTTITFKALNPGLYVYHCATPMVAHHIANGMYGLILVEPEGGLAPVDREFYVMQGEIYTLEPMGEKGLQEFSEEKLLNEDPDYFVLNGAVGALTDQHPLTAKVGETVRIFYGVGGPNFISSFHVIGEIFDRVFDQASLTAPPLTDVQTTLVPAGGATIVEFKVEVPGRYILVDHALARLQRGLAGYLIVEGPEAPDIFHAPQVSDAGH
jgi:nitrite reductase (NO-forming)